MACRTLSRKALKVILGTSVLILAISIGFTLSFESIYDAILKEYISLEKGSLVTKIWEDIPLPIYEKLYFFNITNAEFFLNGSEPLNVTEVGPYTYKSRWVKSNPKWNLNHTVTYRETRTYHFVPEMSNGTEDDMVFTLNGPMIIGASVVPESMRLLFDFYCLVSKQKLIIHKSIRDLAYKGYDDSIIRKAWILNPNLPYKEGKFSWLYGKNATDDGLFTVFTGIDDEKKTDIINNWNGKEKLSFWSGDSCNTLNGTSSETGPPIKDHQDSYTFFQSFICRSVTFNYTQDVLHYDIVSKRFKPTYDLFANSTENPDNYCYEVGKERPSGVLDLSPCQFGAPMLISFPHFHLADPSYLNSINGLNPCEKKHGSHVDVEPVTGVSIDLTVKFQINVEIQKLRNFYFFDGVTKGVFPVFWADLSLKIDETLASFLKRSVRDPKFIAYSVLGVLLCAGWTGVVVAGILLFSPERKDKNDPLINVSDGNFPPKLKSCDCKNDCKACSEDDAKPLNLDESPSTGFTNEASEVNELE